MPPIPRGHSLQKLVGHVGRNLLTIKAIKNGQITSATAAARSFKVPRSTLQDRMKVITSWSVIRATGHKLTHNEEDQSRIG
jgi:hypothetical protein